MSPRFAVSFSANGQATVEVEAPDADTATVIAASKVVGFILDGGEVSWELEDVVTLEGVELAAPELRIVPPPGDGEA